MIFKVKTFKSNFTIVTKNSFINHNLSAERQSNKSTYSVVSQVSALPLSDVYKAEQRGNKSQLELVQRPHAAKSRN